MKKDLDDLVLLYSHEKNAYWRANSCGYTTNISAAGRYLREEAEEIAKASRGQDSIMEIKDNPSYESLWHQFKGYLANCVSVIKSKNDLLIVREMYEMMDKLERQQMTNNLNDEKNL